MAEKKLSGLLASNPAAAITGTEPVETVQAGISVAAIWSQVKTYIAASLALTGTPTAPTAAANNNSTQLATTAYSDRDRGRVLLSTVALAGASASFTINSTYALYEFHLERVAPSTGGSYLLLEVSDDVGTTWKTTGYVSTCGGFNGTASGSDTDTAAIILSGKGTNLSGVDNNKAGLSGVLRCHAPSIVNRCTFEGDVSYVATTSFNQVIARPGGRYDTPLAINAVRFRFSAGNLGGGTIRMSGLKTS